MTWAQILQSILGLLTPFIPLIIILIQKFVPDRVTKTRGEMKWVKEKKEQAINKLQIFHRGMTAAEIAEVGKKYDS